MNLTPDQTARFWAKIDKSSGPGACWLWGGSISHGYGKLRLNRKTCYAHRIAFTLAKGVIPDGWVIDHLCRHPACCNPAHLEAVTNRTNILRGAHPHVLAHHTKHCTRGHALTLDNTYYLMIKEQPVARCRQCKHIANQTYRQGRRLRLTQAA